MSLDLLLARWHLEAMSSTPLPSSILTLRPAVPEDAAAIARLAELDSAKVPSGALLVAVVDGTPLAAVSLETGVVIADPFRPTADLVALLRERAARLSTTDDTRVLKGLRRRLVALGFVGVP